VIRVGLSVFFVCAVVGAWAQQSVSAIVVNEVFRRMPLSKALKTIEENYNLRIAYDHSLVQNVVVDLQLANLSISETLERLLRSASLTYQEVGANIIIVPAPKESAKSQPEKRNITVSGKVFDAETGETLPQATIRINGSAIATTSNNDGHFTILNIPTDTAVLEVSYMGYITRSLGISEIGDHASADIRMSSDAKILNEVVVMDEYNQAVKVEGQPGALVFNPASLNSLPSLGEQDIFRTMQLMPGVSTTDESSSGMVIRGMHPSYNLVLLDGMTIYQQDHFFGSFSIINADVIKDVRVHKGMFDAKYGGRVSGVVDITTKNGNTEKPAFNVRLNSINAKTTAEIPIGKKWSFFAGARRSFTDAVKSNLFKELFDIAQLSNDQIQLFGLVNTFGGTTSPSYFFHDANAKLTFRPSTSDVISLSMYVSRDKMDIDESTIFDDYSFASERQTRWGNNGLSLRWGRQWNSKFYSNLRISDSRFFRNHRIKTSSQSQEMMGSYELKVENNINDFTCAIDNEWLVNKDFTLEFGLSGVWQETDAHIYDKTILTGDFPGEFPEDTDARFSEKSLLHSIYGSVIIWPSRRFTSTAGLRLNHYVSASPGVYAEPRVTTRYKVNDHFNLKAGYARSNQFISQVLYYWETGTVSGLNENFWLLSQPERDAQPVISSDQLSAGATLKGNQLVYDAEMYYKITTGVVIDEDRNAGTTDVYGLDVIIQKMTGIHKGWIAYSLARATQSNPYILNGQAAPSWQDQRHELKIVNMLTLGNWNLSSTTIYGSGKPFPKYTARYYRDDSGNINDYELFLDYRNESRLPAYFRVDLAASYKFRLKGAVELEAGVSIHNVTNHHNVKTRMVDQTELDKAIFTNTELPPVYNDIILLGFSPSAFINVSF